MENNLAEKEKILDVKNLSKEFPGVRALVDFNFDLYKGEVHCLIGENGAGKSTFIKILSGAFSPNSGEIFIGGEKHAFLLPHLARRLGIQTVYQEDILVPFISAAENIFLGTELNNENKLFINYNRILSQADKLAKQFGINIMVDEVYERLSPPDQQFVKILKSLAQKPKVLVLDEPTQAFNIKDIELVTEIVKKIAREGVSIVYIAHNLDEIIQVADRVTVLRDGIKIKTHDKNLETLDTGNLAKEMIGRSVDLFYKKKQNPLGDYVFEVRGLKIKPASKEINFKVRQGEILGIAGLKGAGRSEIAMTIFGALKKHGGNIFFKDKEITPATPIDAVKSGIALLTENKKVDRALFGDAGRP